MDLKSEITNVIDEEGGKIEQDKLVRTFKVKGKASQEEVLYSVRGLMEDGKVAYSHDWQLMIQD